MMKIIRSFLVSNTLLWAIPLCAHSIPIMNTISMDFQADAWVATHKPQVMLQVDGTLERVAADNLYKTISSRLRKIADAQWHIVDLRQKKDPSGLERMTIQAQARLEQKQLAQLREKVNALSEPGMNYSLVSIRYVPSMEDVEKTRGEVRGAIYQQVNAELERLNKQYPASPYHVSRIYFSRPDHPRPLMGTRYKMALVQKDEADPASQPTEVSQRLVEKASVEFSTHPLIPKHP